MTPNDLGVPQRQYNDESHYVKDRHHKTGTEIMIDVLGFFTIPESELELSFARASGPGGQNVNKVNSKVFLTWNISSSPSIPRAVKDRFVNSYPHRLTTEGCIVISSDRFRDQKRNISDCMEKLVAMLEPILKPKKTRKKTRPSRGSVERRLTEKKKQSARKADRQPKGGSSRWD